VLRARRPVGFGPGWVWWEERGWAEMRRRRGDGQIGWMGRACKGRDVGTIQAWCVGSYSP
jgi:hypothetical protein